MPASEAGTTDWLNGRIAARRGISCDTRLQSA